MVEAPGAWMSTVLFAGESYALALSPISRASSLFLLFLFSSSPSSSFPPLLFSRASPCASPVAHLSPDLTPSLSTSDPLIVSPFLLYNHLALLSPLLSPLSSLLSIRASSLSSPINSPTPLILVIFVILGFSRLFSIIHPSMIRSSR